MIEVLYLFDSIGNEIECVLFEDRHIEDSEAIKKVAWVFSVHFTEFGKLVAVLSFHKLHVLHP